MSMAIFVSAIKRAVTETDALAEAVATALIGLGASMTYSGRREGFAILAAGIILYVVHIAYRRECEEHADGD